MQQKHYASFQLANTAWVISDGTKGMEVQSLGLAEAMGLETTLIQMNLPPLLRHFPRSGRMPLIPLPKIIKQHAQNGWPDVIITTGRRMAGLSILCRQKARGTSRTIHIQNPNLPTSLFDLLIIPSHDRLRGHNILQTTGSLNNLTHDKITKDYEALPSVITTLPKPLIAVMIGGSNRRYKVHEQDFIKLADYLSALAHAVDGSLVLITSRRSHEMASQILRRRIGHGLLEAPPHWIWNGEAPNPYPGILHLADAVVVTSDSVNMTCEACMSGKPVYRYNFRQEAGRIGLFHRIMEEGGFTLPLLPIDASSFATNTSKPLHETKRIAHFLMGKAL